ncbi:MAG TPA: flagellar protein export ATPase FliI, partial [Stellaceae bacterium]|nr:flagellar protein export ATPase FliI [Stellaceae bacterium]
MALIAQVIEDIENFPEYRRYGRVTGVNGMLLELGGMPREVTVGARCEIATQDRRRVACEVVGFRAAKALAMPFTALDGIGLGCRVELATGAPVVYPHESWLGRVVNAMGEPIDGKGPLTAGRIAYPLRASPPPAHARQRVQGKVDLGVRAINTFLTCCRGQRMGIFAGSGVGKSTLMSMFARYTAVDAIVIGLVGERGREVQEFIADDLGPEGLARSIVVVATSDESPLMRRQAAHMTLAIAEFLRDRDRDVLCLIDSVTRFATAQREIGLAAGEPPTTRGYTPTVFAELPKLLERAGPGTGKGSITGLFSVLVDGDDTNEPVADALRSILDGHIVLDRAIAERGRYPAINILRSISRMMPQCNADDETSLIATARGHVSVYEDMAELIRLGAYRRGSDPRVDEAIRLYPAIEAFLAQRKEERADFAGGYAALK